MSIQFARRRAERLIEQCQATSYPVDVADIAKQLGLPVIYDDLGSDVSGLLVSKGGNASIVVNEKDAPVRKRFTIAHEIAHHVLQHQFEPGEHVHVDRGNFISQRGLRASQGVDPKEVQANQFAAALLMPTDLVSKAVSKIGRSQLHDQDVQSLAEKFEVSEQAMTIRLSTLGYL